MALPLPDGRRGQMLALAITALTLGLIWIGTIIPALEWYDVRNEQLRLQHAMAHRMAALVETLPALRRDVEAVGQGTRETVSLLTGGSDTVAAATLQQRIDEMATAAGLRLASEEILPAAAAGDLRAIAVRISVSGPWRSFVALLLDLGQAEIPMIVDEIQLRGSGGQVRAPEIPIDAGLTVTSYRAAGDLK
jgi:general secretion pathway protein M